MLILISGSLAAETIDRDKGAELMEECQVQRQEKIAPLKEEAIENCVSKRLRDRAGCEDYNRNFGERSVAGAPTGMFWDLPVCEKAIAAQQYFNRNPRAQTYEHK
jgi:hypothetical protein